MGNPSHEAGRLFHSQNTLISTTAYSLRNWSCITFSNRLVVQTLIERSTSVQPACPLMVFKFNLSLAGFTLKKVICHMTLCGVSTSLPHKLYLDQIFLIIKGHCDYLHKYLVFDHGHLYHTINLISYQLSLSISFALISTALQSPKRGFHDRCERYVFFLSDWIISFSVGKTILCLVCQLLNTLYNKTSWISRWKVKLYYYEWHTMSKSPELSSM